MENSYILGADTHPLRGQQKGSRSYTDKFEEEHPGIICQLYPYAEKRIGNQASYADLANCMDEKAAVKLSSIRAMSGVGSINRVARRSHRKRSCTSPKIIRRNAGHNQNVTDDASVNGLLKKRAMEQ